MHHDVPRTARRTGAIGNERGAKRRQLYIYFKKYNYTYN